MIKNNVKKGFNFFKFFWNVIVTIILIGISSFNIAFDAFKDGITTSTYILITATSVYLFIIILHFLLLKSRLQNKDEWKLKEAIYYTKYLISLIKFLVPIALIFNLIGHPIYDTVVFSFSIFSIFFGFIGFIIDTVKAIHRYKTREKRYNKHLKKKNKSAEKQMIETKIDN